MSMSPVTPAASSATTGVDSITSEPGADAPPAGFDLLLAVHAEPHTARPRAGKPAHEMDDDADTNTEARGCDLHAPADPAAGPETPEKAEVATDLDGRLAALGAPLPAPVPVPVPVPAATVLPPALLPVADTTLDAFVDPPIAVTNDLPDLLTTIPTDAIDDALAETALPALELEPTIDAELTSLLLAPTPTEESAPSTVSMPITPLLSERFDAEAGEPVRSESPAPVAPASNAAPVLTETPRPEPARSTAMPEPSPFVPPTALAPSATAATAAPVNAAETVARSVAPPPPAEQLVSVLAPLRTSANGSYTLHLELRPAELGRVEMRVEMRDGVLHASIHADREASAHLVRAALNELRDQLASEGVRTGSLTVSDGALGSSGREGARHARADADASRSGSSQNPASADSAEPNITIADTNDPLTEEATSLLDVRV